MIFDSEFFNQRGLNLQAGLTVTQLPQDIKDGLSQVGILLSEYQQLIVFGHAGKQLWQSLTEQDWQRNQPIDDYSADLVANYFNQTIGIDQYYLLFPGQTAIGLQQIGKAVGWHYDSPLRIGVNREWGSWFAYRALVISKVQFEIKNSVFNPVCNRCSSRECIVECPANALKGGALALEPCLDYRRQPNSLCADRCLARMACPVAKPHQYSEAQIQYHYSQSFRTIKSGKSPM